MMGGVTFAYSPCRLDQRGGFSVETPGSEGDLYSFLPSSEGLKNV